MRVTGHIPVSSVIYKKRRLPLNFKVLRFALEMLRGDKFPPIQVYPNPSGKGTFKLKDGRNRLSAAKLTGAKTILAHYAIVEDPYPYKTLPYHEKVDGPRSQGDGCPLDLSETPKE